MTRAKRTSVVVLASGRGTNFRNICEDVRAGRLPARVEALITNVEGAPCTAIAREFGVPAVEVPSRGLSRGLHEERLLEALSGFRCDWLVLAGYMRVFTPAFLKAFEDRERGIYRAVNIHPSLLPAFPGRSGYRAALQYGVKVTGVTVHLVGAGVDDGPIVMQQPLEIRHEDTAETLEKRGLWLEHQVYSEALRALFTRPWRVTGGPEKDGRPRVVFEDGK